LMPTSINHRRVDDGLDCLAMERCLARISERL
jgi:hypothetical protein